MKIFYEHSHPYGFINRKCIKGVTKTKRGYYIIDIDYNYLRISEETFNELSLSYPIIENRRKGV